MSSRFVTRSHLVAWSAAIALLSGCGSSGTSSDGSEDAVVDSPGLDAQADADALGRIGDPIGGNDAGTTPDPGPIGGGDDPDAGGDPASADAGDAEEAIPNGAFGDPCNGNSDCLSGWCVEGVAGYICTKTCDLTCPDQFDCKAVSTGQDVVFLCMPRLQKLCTPCSAAIHCPGGACLALDGEGRCGYSCEEDSECPVGYGCQEDPDEVDSGTFCQPLTGSCACNASTDGGQRTCSEANAIGECFGVQTCHTTDGWGSAPPPCRPSRAATGSTTTATAWSTNFSRALATPARTPSTAWAPATAC